jgi:hypothetical protein
MPALPPYIIDPIWEQFDALLPERDVHHPHGQKGKHPLVARGCGGFRYPCFTSTNSKPPPDTWPTPAA